MHLKTHNVYASVPLSELKHLDIRVYSLWSTEVAGAVLALFDLVPACPLQFCRAAACYSFLTSVCCRIIIFSGSFSMLFFPALQLGVLSGHF